MESVAQSINFTASCRQPALFLSIIPIRVFTELFSSDLSGEEYTWVSFETLTMSVYPATVHMACIVVVLHRSFSVVDCRDVLKESKLLKSESASTLIARHLMTDHKFTLLVFCIALDDLSCGL